MRLLDAIDRKLADFRSMHGPVLRVGNTAGDIGKRAVDPGRKDPMIALREHLVVNDTRIVDILKSFDPDDTLTVTSEQFASALEVRSRLLA